MISMEAPGGADEGGEGGARGQEGAVDQRRGLEVAPEPDPARDHVEAGQQDDERRVVARGVREDAGRPRQVEEQHRQAEAGRHEQLVPVRLPPVRQRERQERDGEEHRREGQHGIERERSRHGASLLS